MPYLFLLFLLVFFCIYLINFVYKVPILISSSEITCILLIILNFLSIRGVIFILPIIFIFILVRINKHRFIRRFVLIFIIYLLYVIWGLTETFTSNSHFNFQTIIHFQLIIQDEIWYVIRLCQYIKEYMLWTFSNNSKNQISSTLLLIWPKNRWGRN